MEPFVNKDRNWMEGNIFHHIKVNVRRQDSTEHMEVSLGKDCVTITINESLLILTSLSLKSVFHSP